MGTGLQCNHGIFISKFLQPNREFLGQVSRAVDIICSFMKENCFRNSSTKVLKVVKGGSSAKGTALRGRSDADLVVFLSCFCGFADQGTNRAEIIAEIRAQLEACRREKQFDVKFEISKWENPRVLSFTLTSKTLDHSVDFDVLPAFNALGQLSSGTKPDTQVYIDLINSYNNGGEFSSCFTELQRDFVISRPTKLKSLIRLVKHWYKQVKPSRQPLHSSGVGNCGPTKMSVLPKATHVTNNRIRIHTLALGLQILCSFQPASLPTIQTNSWTS
uniref:2'-5' oligoadenylate synthase n=1 Tax=Vombatus ursinus TaxID=29139 RepID=A0A4X2K0I4_VOMUR